MAAVAGGVQTVTITINDIEIQVPKGELIVESVKRIGLEVPVFCYHPRMKPVGMCRMCLVEIGTKMPDGTTASATVILTVKDQDHFVVRSTDRIVAGAEEPDFELVIARKPPQPAVK
jgi:NADH dehydrogenase/NADH:ubiquinone oxidoreductase subunit G